MDYRLNRLKILCFPLIPVTIIGALTIMYYAAKGMVKISEISK